MSDLDEELYGLIADDEDEEQLNELEKEQKLAEEAEKNQIKEDKRKLAEMLKNRNKKNMNDNSSEYSNEVSDDDFLVKPDSDDAVYKMRDRRERMETKPPNLNHLKSLQLSRDKLAQIVFRRDFEDIVIGAFVRVPVRENTYRICEIVEVVRHKLYNLAPEIQTDKSILIRYGNDKTRVYMSRISNKPFESDEWKRWLLKMKEDIKRHPLELRHMQDEEILNKAEVLSIALNKRITEEELAHIINERKKIVGENVTMLRLNLKRKLAVAVSQNNEAEINDIKLKLSHLGEHQHPVPHIKPHTQQIAKQSQFIIPKIDIVDIIGSTTNTLDDINVKQLIQ